MYILYIVSIDHFSLELNSVTLELSERQATFSVLTAILQSVVRMIIIIINIKYYLPLTYLLIIEANNNSFYLYLLQLFQKTLDLVFTLYQGISGSSLS